MSQPLNDYLDRVARELRALPATARENELREVHSHLEQLIDDGVKRGQSQDVATQNALATFGGARAVGIGVRDVWEGQETGWKPWVTALVRGFLFWIGTMVLLMISAAAFQSWPQSALLPESTTLVFYLWIALVPIAVGAIHALYLGRRAWILSATIFGALWMAETTIGGPPSLSIFAFQLSFWALCLVLGVAGALLTDGWLRRQRYAVLACAGTNASASTLALPPRSRVKLTWKPLLILVVPLALAAAGKQRLDAAAHPQSATEAVRIALLTTRDATKIARPSIIRLDELASTQADLGAGTQRVRFEVLCHMTQDYRERRLAFLMQQLATNRGQYGEAELRSSLRRIRANNFPLSGEVQVKNTSSGWKIDEKSYDFSRLWGWAEDVLYTE